jgi:ABC-type phosphate/phosphonate transport system substrate-binding protein
MSCFRFGAPAAIAAALVCAVPDARAQNAPDVVQIGLVDSLFHEVPTPLVNMMLKPFSDLMKDLTGFNGKAVPSGDAFALAKKLDDKSLHLGVFQGFEYAWVKDKYPDLKPLMIAVYYDRHLKAHMVVNAKSSDTSIAGLKGKACAVPSGTTGHCRLFVDRQIAACGGCEAKAFFKQVTKPASSEDALDDVCSGAVEATIVDHVALECYRRIKPGCFKRLKILKDSETFPAPVIAYREGVFAAADLDKFKKGMRNAHSTAWGKQLMQIMKITAFEGIPEDYPTTVANIARAYPPPAPAVAPAANLASGK